MKPKYSTFFVIKEILKYAWRGSRVYTALLIIFAVLLGLFPFLNAYVYKEIIDYFISNVNSSLGMKVFLTYGALLVFFRFAESSLAYLDSYLQVKLRDIIAPIIQYDFLSKVNRLPYTAFENHELYDLISDRSWY